MDSFPETFNDLLASHVTVDATSEHLYDYALQFSALLGSTSISGTFSHPHLH